MLAKEQIKSLKPGDPIVINTTFAGYDADGDIRFNSLSENGSCYQDFISPDYVSLPSEHGTSVPTPEHAITFCHVVDNMVNPKYDPLRKFREGDKAKVVERNGRNVTCFPVGRIKVGDIVTVAENESGDVFIKVLTESGHEMMVPWFMLELVSPMEEQMPYSIDPANTNVLFKHGKKFATFEDDDEAQEVCDRLNTEWIKEQNTNE